MIIEHACCLVICFKQVVTESAHPAVIYACMVLLHHSYGIHFLKPQCIIAKIDVYLFVRLLSHDNGLAMVEWDLIINIIIMCLDLYDIIIGN